MRTSAAPLLLGLLEQHLGNWKSITLDTRVFNTPAQQAYEKAGFQRVTPHPIALKDRFYIRYEKNNAETPIVANEVLSFL